VLQFDGEQSHHFHGDTGRPGDTHCGIVVDDEHLLDVALGDEIADRRSAIAGDEHPTAEGGRHDGGAVRAGQGCSSRGWHGTRPAGYLMSWQHLWRRRREELGER
jgi:hypothetical protein